MDEFSISTLIYSRRICQVNCIFEINTVIQNIEKQLLYCVILSIIRKEEKISPATTKRQQLKEIVWLSLFILINLKSHLFFFYTESSMRLYLITVWKRADSFKTDQQQPLLSSDYASFSVFLSTTSQLFDQTVAKTCVEQGKNICLIQESLIVLLYCL